MGLAYLTRYDAVGTWRPPECWSAPRPICGPGSPPRLRRALLDLLLVSGPGFAAFVGWAVASWLITGDAFAQFTSQYGNAAILEQSGGAAAVSFGSGLAFAAVCITLLAPTLIPIAAWAGFLRWRRPNWAMLVVPLMLYGAVLAFQTYTYATGATFPFLRFYIVAIPFAARLALLAVPDGAFVEPTRRGRYAPVPSSEPSARSTRFGYAAVALAFAIGLPVTAWGMSLPTYAPQEYALGAVLQPDPDRRQLPQGRRAEDRGDLLHRA